MAAICFIGSDLLHILSVIILCNWFLVLRKRKNKIGKYFVVLMTFVCSVLMLVTSNEVIKCIEYIICIISILFITYDETVKRLAVSGIWLMLLLALLTEMSNVLKDIILDCFPVRIPAYTENLMISFITLMFVGIICKILYLRHRDGIQTIHPIYIFLFAVIMALDSIVLLFFHAYISEITEIGRKLIFEWVFIGMVIGLFAQIVILLLFIVSRNVYKEREALAQEYLNEQKAHYEYLQKREEQTKRFRHDIREHLSMMQILCRKGNYQEISDYLNTINEMIECLGNQFSVNNDIVDAILNKYAAEAEKHGVKMEVGGQFPPADNISVFDVCTIFSNLLKNAVETAKKCEHGRVFVQCGYEKNNILITVKNDYQGILQTEKGRLKTSKKDIENHGFGLQNVEECAKRNGGSMEIETLDNCFKAVVLLKYKKQCADDAYREIGQECK